MSRLLLTADSDWELVNGFQDVRGFAAIDARGDQVGTVMALVIDTDAELVSAIMLDSGDEVPALDITIGDRVVYLSGSIPGAATVPDIPEALVHHRVVRREVVEVAPVVEVTETVLQPGVAPVVTAPAVAAPAGAVPVAPAPQAFVARPAAPAAAPVQMAPVQMAPPVAAVPVAAPAAAPVAVPVAAAPRASEWVDVPVTPVIR